VFSFGIDLTKLFSDLDSESATEMDMFKHVKFKLWNETDGYWLTATRDEETGIYYVTGHVTEEADATIFYPVTVGGEFGKVVIKGMENDCWNIYEVETANGYTLLKDEIYVDIFVEENYDRICDIYTKDVLGVLQNDSHYCCGNGQPVSMTNGDVGLELHPTGMHQEYMEHYFLNAYATVNSNNVNMENDGESENALVPLAVVNTKGFDLPRTGDSGTIFFAVAGMIVMAGAMFVLFLVTRRDKKNEKK
jgi:LPXTG-motif cell wall-anchored protein